MKPLWVIGQTFSLLALSAAVTLAPLTVHAEEEDGVTPVATPAKARPKPKPKPKPKPPVLTLPAAPVPYTQLKAAGPAPLKAPTPVLQTPAAVVVKDTPPAPVLQPLRPVVADIPPPPPAPPVYVAPTHDLRRTHDLKCETQTVDAKGAVSKGTFYLEITLSDVFPDEAARFKVMFADPRHPSLMKDTLCETIACTVKISPNFYDLYNQRTKRGASLRVTLDRQSGAFLAQKTEARPRLGVIGMKADPVDYEQGYCRPQSRPDKLF